MAIPKHIKRQMKKGGYLAGKDKGRPVKLTNSRRGGIAVGAKHGLEGGIKGEVGTEKKPIEFEGEEIIITAPAVKDNTKREFEGQMLTNRQILSKINESGGGVSFADGGEIPGKIRYGKGITYKVGGKTMSAHEVVKYCGCGCEHTKMEEGGTVDKSNQAVAAIEKKLPKIFHEDTLKIDFSHKLSNMYVFTMTSKSEYPVNRITPKLQRLGMKVERAGEKGKRLLSIPENIFNSLSIKFAEGGELKKYYQAFAQPSGSGTSQVWHLISYPEFDQVDGMFFQEKTDAEKYADKKGIEIIDYSDFNKYGKLIDAFKKIDNPGHSMEQATGLDAGRTRVHYPPAYHASIKMVGTELVQQAISLMPQAHKNLLIKAWKGRIVPKELRDAVKAGNFATGGQISEPGQELPSGYSNSNWNEKLKEAIPDLDKIKSILVRLQKEFTSKYPNIKWTVQPSTSAWNKINFGYELYFETKEHLPQRFLNMSIVYNTRKKHDYSNEKEITCKNYNPYSASIYYYPETEAYGGMTTNANPTILQRNQKPFSFADVKELLKDMEKEFTYLKNYFSEGGSIADNTNVLSIVFNNNPDFETAKAFFESEKSSLRPFYYNDEFRSIDFEVKGQQDADVTEDVLLMELNEAGITNYHFESSHEDNMKKGGFVPSHITDRRDRSEYQRINQALDELNGRESFFYENAINYSPEERQQKFKWFEDERKKLFDQLNKLSGKYANKMEKGGQISHDEIKADLALGSLLDHRARDYKLLKATVDFPVAFETGGAIATKKLSWDEFNEKYPDLYGYKNKGKQEWQLPIDYDGGYKTYYSSQQNAHAAGRDIYRQYLNDNEIDFAKGGNIQDENHVGGNKALIVKLKRNLTESDIYRIMDIAEEMGYPIYITGTGGEKDFQVVLVDDTIDKSLTWKIAKEIAFKAIDNNILVSMQEDVYSAGGQLRNTNSADIDNIAVLLRKKYLHE